MCALYVERQIIPISSVTKRLDVWYNAWATVGYTEGATQWEPKITTNRSNYCLRARLKQNRHDFGL